jgi:hypothetical protein
LYTVVAAIMNTPLMARQSTMYTYAWFTDSTEEKRSTPAVSGIMLGTNLMAARSATRSKRARPNPRLDSMAIITGKRISMV